MPPGMLGMHPWQNFVKRGQSIIQISNNFNMATANLQVPIHYFMNLQKDDMSDMTSVNVLHA